MAILISAHQLTKSFTSRPLFTGLTFSIESGQRIGLIGPNGAGKSTLLKILAGKTTPDDGQLSIQRGLRVGYVEQVPSFTTDATVESSILEGHHDPHDWQVMAKAQELMSKLSLSGPDVTADMKISELSGGWKKRVALARELLREPDLLLLDEPTNHLDVESVLWLEELLAHAPFATVTITHDRLFLQRISNRILELDRRHPGGLLTVDGDYATYTEVREALMDAQESHETKLRNTLRRETEWLRRGAKARQTKQQARIQKAGDLKSQVEELGFRNRSSSIQIDFQSGEKNPKKLIEAHEISKSYNDHVIIPQLDLKIGPQSRIGLMGSNGCGKSTLIRLLLGKEKPDTGSVFLAERLKVAYFEQNRESLDPKKTLMESICPAGEYVDYRGTKIHAKGYLNRFLFTHEQMGLPVGKLSGGEQSRLLIARLMLDEANVLVLDEPTNDLDIATLDILEDVLKEFSGAVILVTHDRYFLDQVTPHILAFGVNEKGEKGITPLMGLEQWEEWYDIEAQKKKTAQSNASKEASGGGQKKRKLSYKDQRELDGMEENIKVHEEKLAVATAESLKPENLSNGAKLTELSQQMATLQEEIDRLYARWGELEKA